VTGSTRTLAPERKLSGAGAYTEPTTGVTFFLGTHHPGWLRTAAVPLFISDRRLRTYRRLPRAAGPWALDSGGFSELATHGTWANGPTPGEYAARIRRYRDEIGHLVWAAPQDWMCEPWILAKTGLTLVEHQRRTVGNFLDLAALAPDLPIIPVLQGWTVPDYLDCAEIYRRAGVDLVAAPLVGLGSVCRRQSTTDAAHILTAVHTAGVKRLHGFGFKVQGLARCGHLLTSADSMAWSYAARRRPPLPGCVGHINCANCPRYAYRWYHHVTQTLTSGQLALFDLPTGAAV
jgi:hypothetical protein